MLIIIALLCLIAAVVVLVWASIIDLREWILPDELTLAFLALGIVFHFVTFNYILAPIDMILGGIAGGGVLYVIRAIANKAYGQDTLGLGDVKLMFAGGLWVGAYYSMIALAVGAFAGMIIGLIFLALPHDHPDDIKPEEGASILKVSVPAGPGFAFGIVAAIGYMIYEWPGLGAAIQQVKELF